MSINLRKRLTHFAMKTVVCFVIGYFIAWLSGDANLAAMALIFIYVFDLSLRQDFRDMGVSTKDERP